MQVTNNQETAYTPASESKKLTQASLPLRLADSIVFSGVKGLVDKPPEIQLPSISREDVDNAFSEIAQTETLGQSSQSLLKSWSKGRKLKQQRKAADQHLPEKVKKRVRAYRWSPQFVWDWTVRNRQEPGYTERQLTVLKGPLAIKAKQAQVEKSQAQLERLEQTQEFLKAVIKHSALRAVPTMVIGSRVKALKKEVVTYGPLRDSVPALPKDYFKEALEKVEQEYQKQTGDQITSIGKAIGTGSIGQVFLAETKKHGKVVIKVHRPDANEADFQAMAPYLYYNNVLEEGIDAKDKAWRDAKSTIGLVTRELDLRAEQETAHTLHDYLKDKGSKLNIPTIYAATPSAFVQAYAGSTPISQLTDKELKRQVTRDVLPDLLKLLLFCPTKYADFHGGNLLVSPEAKDLNPTLIDFGRVVQLHPDKQDQLIHLLTSQLLQTDPLHPELTQQAKQALTPLLEDKHSDVFLEELYKALFPSLLTTWSKYSIAQGVKGSSEEDKTFPLKSLLTEPVSMQDLRDSQRKFKNLFSSAFSFEPSKAEVKAYQVELQSPKHLLDLFSPLVLEKQHWKASHSINSDHLIKTLKTVEASVEGFDDLLTAAMDGNQKTYQKELKSILSDEKARTNLMRVTHVYHQLFDLASDVLDAWPTKLQYKELMTRNMVILLRKDFGLDDAEDYIPTSP